MYTCVKGAICGAAMLLGVSSAVRADVITDWNNDWFDTIRAVGGPPCPLARNQAVLYVSIYEAVNSIDRAYEPYSAYQDVTLPCSERAAAAAAAHTVLTTLYPARAAIYDATYAAQLAAITNVEARDNGVDLGEAAANAILTLRSNDRTNTVFPYVYQDVPGSYRPTAPDFTSPPFNPGWGTTQCWAMSKGDELRPGGPFGYNDFPTLLRSKGYTKQFKEVLSKGARNSRARTAEQTEIAWFWANDRNGTFKPPGHLAYITEVVAQQEGLTFEDEARLFALVGIALGDAGAVAWDQKYAMDLWRPITAIRQADIDNNPKTQKNANWLPLLEFTPPFPAYTSGHATFGAAHAAIMRNFFGTDRVRFTVGTDEPIVQNVTRTFKSFTQLARENGLSRVYLGVHFRFDADIAYSSGTRLGNFVFESYLRPVSEANRQGVTRVADPTLFTAAFFTGHPSADLNDDDVVDGDDYFIFVADYLASGSNGPDAN